MMGRIGKWIKRAGAAIAGIFGLDDLVDAINGSGVDGQKEAIDNSTGRKAVNDYFNQMEEAFDELERVNIKS